MTAPAVIVPERVEVVVSFTKNGVPHTARYEMDRVKDVSVDMKWPEEREEDIGVLTGRYFIIPNRGPLHFTLEVEALPDDTPGGNALLMTLTPPPGAGI